MMPVFISVLIIAAGLAFAAFLFSTVRGASDAKGSLDEVATITRPVDLLAFQNLTDPAEEEFLRARLSRDAFRRVQKERLRAALEYVERAAWNAAVLLRVGEALRKEEPAVAAVGQEIVNAALRLRLYALLVMALLHVRIWFPGIETSVQQVPARYEELRNQFARVARMRRPAQAGHLLSAL